MCRRLKKKRSLLTASRHVYIRVKHHQRTARSHVARHVRSFTFVSRRLQQPLWSVSSPAQNHSNASSPSYKRYDPAETRHPPKPLWLESSVSGNPLQSPWLSVIPAACPRDTQSRKRVPLVTSSSLRSSPCPLLPPCFNRSCYIMASNALRLRLPSLRQAQDFILHSYCSPPDYLDSLLTKTPCT